MTEQADTVPAVTAEEARELVGRLVRFTFLGDLAATRAFVEACAAGMASPVGQANLELAREALDELEAEQAEEAALADQGRHEESLLADERLEITDDEIAAVGEAMDGPRPTS